MYVYVCILHACNATGGQKRASDHLGLELQMVVNGYVDLRSLEVQPVLLTVEASLQFQLIPSF